uniref:hypothetical protein n=1 Tax=uncultured Sphingomonas sp. TaxID=158754 RepID=UPI0025E5D7C0|nr:hypothetical protein [uncultured Sphingomonas sp.]
MWLFPALSLLLASAAGAPAATSSPPPRAGATTRAEPPPGQALLPALETLTPPQRASLEQLLLDMGKATSPDAAIAAADKLLAQLPEPSRLRGMVQFFRAAPLAASNREPAAALAIEESIRLLPEHSGPLIAAAGIYAYGHTPGRGADHLLRAAEIDPGAIRSLDEYTVFNLLHRLGAENDKRRVQAISERLLAIDWQGQRLATQSGLARNTIKAQLARKDVGAARALVPRLLDPADSFHLLTLKEAEPIWSDIERWAGPKLEKQWAIYLREAKARWSASKSTDTVLDYSAALEQAHHDRTLIREVLPLFDAPDAEADGDLLFIVARLGAALAREGRWADADAMFATARRVWPLDSQANALNIAANHAVHLFRAGRTADGLNRMDEALRAASGLGAQVNSDAIRAMHWSRACALVLAGREREAAASVAAVLGHAQPVSKATLQLCLNDRAAAKRSIMEALQHPDQRDSVIGFLQIQGQPIRGSRFSNALYSRYEALRTDPELLAAAAPYGRVLPFRVAEGAPPEAP